MAMSGSNKFRSKNPSGDSSSGNEAANLLNLSRLLKNNDQRERFQKSFLGRKILSPKFTSHIAFHSFNFPQLLTAQNVDGFMNDHGVYYPDLVRVFYCNLHSNPTGITSWVKGVPIRMTIKQIGQCLGLSTTGEKLHTDFHCEWEDYDRKAFYLSLCRFSETEISAKKQRIGSSSSRNVLSVGNLTVEDRLLHYILCYILVPKASNYSQISDFELQILYAIKTNKAINWSHLIVNHMVSQVDRSSGLPYAIAISRILESCNVDITNEIAVQMTRAENEINPDILNKMGIVRDKVTLTYTHRSDNIGEPSNPPPPPQDIGQSSQASQASQEITNQMLMDEMRSFRSYMEMRLDDISTRLSRLEANADDDDDEDAES